MGMDKNFEKIKGTVKIDLKLQRDRINGPGGNGILKNSFHTFRNKISKSVDVDVTLEAASLMSI